MKKALVTGCAGFIGSHLVEKLINDNWQVVGLDNFHSYYDKQLKLDNSQNFLNHKNFQFIEGSILSDNDLTKCRNVDCVFHLAAIAGVRNSFEHPQEYFEINVQGTKSLLNHFQNIENLVFASSSSVYGNLKDDELPVKETHPLNPISPYGESKKQAEKLCIDYARKTNVKTSILRFYTVYGPRQRPDEAITKFIKLVQAGKSIPIYGDGKKLRDFTYVSDIINGILLAEKFGDGIYNLGSGKPITVNQMVSTIESAMKVKIRREFYDPQKGDVEKTHADISKAQKELGYFPTTSFEEGIRRSVKWCESKCVV